MGGRKGPLSCSTPPRHDLRALLEASAIHRPLRQGQGGPRVKVGDDARAPPLPTLPCRVPGRGASTLHSSTVTPGA